MAHGVCVNFNVCNKKLRRIVCKKSLDWFKLRQIKLNFVGACQGGYEQFYFFPKSMKKLATD